MDIVEVRPDIERSHVPASRVLSGAFRPASSSGNGAVFQHLPDTDQVPSRATYHAVLAVKVCARGLRPFANPDGCAAPC